MVGQHFEYIRVDHALAHLEVDLIVEAESHELSYHASFVAAFVQAFEFALIVQNW